MVFPVMHGPWGQDGTLQGLLEMAGVRYVGAGVLSSAVGTDKHFMKQLFMAAGLPVLPYVLVRPRQWERDPAAIREAVEALELPGLRQARPGRLQLRDQPGRRAPTSSTPRSRRPAASTPRCWSRPRRRNAREVEIGVLQGLDGGGPETSEIAEITVATEHAFYDFEAKYLEQSYRIPASLDEEIAAQMRELAVRAFEALDVEGLARVDFFVMPDDRVVVNEVETMPGFTATSMFPLLWQAVGPDLPRAGRAARPARDGAGDRSALSSDASAAGLDDLRCAP